MPSAMGARLEKPKQAIDDDIYKHTHTHGHREN